MGKRGNPNIAELGKKTQFKPGQSGNPAGPPKGYRGAKEVLRLLLSIEHKSVGKDGLEKILTTEERLHLAAIRQALGGDMTAYNNIMRQLEDKEAQKVTITFASDVNAMPDGKFTDIIKSLHGSDGDTGD